MGRSSREAKCITVNVMNHVHTSKLYSFSSKSSECDVEGNTSVTKCIRLQLKIYFEISVTCCRWRERSVDRLWERSSGERHLSQINSKRANINKSHSVKIVFRKRHFRRGFFQKKEEVKRRRRRREDSMEHNFQLVWNSWTLNTTTAT